MGLGRGHVEISQTRFPQAHTLHRFNNTETTLTSTAPEAVQTTGSTSRFISTHPDQDHLQGLVQLDDRFELLNCYVVKNVATKSDETVDFKRYKKLRDHSRKAFYIKQGCARRWMNQGSNERGSSGIEIKWPVRSNEEFKEALKRTEDGGSPNNISPVITYSLNGGATVTWMGDLENDFMKRIGDAFTRSSGRAADAPPGAAGRQTPARRGRNAVPGLQDIESDTGYDTRRRAPAGVVARLSQTQTSVCDTCGSATPASHAF